MTKEGSVKGKKKKRRTNYTKFIDLKLVFLFANKKIAAKQRHTSISPQRVKRARDHRVCSSNIISFELSSDVARLDGLSIIENIKKRRRKKKKRKKKKKKKRKKKKKKETKRYYVQKEHKCIFEGARKLCVARCEIESR